MKKSLLTEAQRLRLLMGLNTLLTEDDLREITSKDAKERYYPNVDNALYAKIVPLDPTYNQTTDQLGRYSKWLLRNDNLNLVQKTKPEDVYKIRDDLALYDRLKNSNKLPAEYKDINAFNLKHLTDYIFANYTNQENFNADSITSQTQDIKNIKQNADKYTVGGFTIINPKTEESACFYGKGTRWCTAADNNNMFNSYNSDGKIWILIDKDSPSEKYQFHFESEQFMDAKDTPIRVGEFFADHNEVYQFFIEQYPQIDFIIAKYSIEHGTEEEFSYYYSDNFTDDQKNELVDLLINKISENSDNNVDDAINMLYNIKYDYKSYKNSDGKYMTQNKSNYNRALESAARYDAYNNDYNGEHYATSSFINIFGGLDEDDVDLLYNELHTGDIDVFLDILNSFDNGSQLLNQYIVDNDLQNEFNTKNDVLNTITKLKKMYPSYPRIENKLAKIYVRQVDFENGTFNIQLNKKDALGKEKTEYGNIDYRNIFDYLQNYSLFEHSRVSSLLTEVHRLRSLMELNNTEIKVTLKDGRTGVIMDMPQLGDAKTRVQIDGGGIEVVNQDDIVSADNRLDVISKETNYDNSGTNDGGTAFF